MADTDSISSSGEAEFFISESDITEAVKVIRPIPKLPTERATTVRFTVRCDGHCASIHVKIKPYRLQGTTNCGFRAFCRATPCHSSFNDSELYYEIQKVYDAIVPVQWIFGSDCTDIVRGAPLTSDAPCCQHTTSCDQRPLDLNSADEAAPSEPHSGPPPHSRLPRKRSHNETSELTDIIAPAELGPQRRKPIQKIADDFIAMIKNGQKLLKKRRSTTPLSGIQGILSRCEQEDINHVLSKLSKEFHRESRQKSIKSDSWDYWYFEGCMDLVNRTNGEVAKSSSAARAVQVVNSVVNRLLLTDGAVAVVIFGALAETGCRLTDISRADTKSRDIIVSLAAQELHKNLEPPPPWYQIPNAAVWVALVKNRSGSGTPLYNFGDACRDLALPNLAALDLKPQWIGDASSKSLLMKVDFSLVQTPWMATGVDTQQPVNGHVGEAGSGAWMHSESEVTQLNSSSGAYPNALSLGAGFTAPTDHRGSGLGDISEQQLGWSNFDFDGAVANMGCIDFGSERTFGLGSLDGIMRQ